MILSAHEQFQSFAKVAENLIQRCSLRYNRHLEALGRKQAFTFGNDRVNCRT